MKLTHEEWLEERRKSIGGSDAAALVGMNPYVTPYMLWADKTGRLPPKEDNEAMRQGRDLKRMWLKGSAKPPVKGTCAFPNAEKS